MAEEPKPEGFRSLQDVYDWLAFVVGGGVAYAVAHHFGVHELAYPMLGSGFAAVGMKAAVIAKLQPSREKKRLQEKYDDIKKFLQGRNEIKTNTEVKMLQTANDFWETRKSSSDSNKEFEQQMNRIEAATMRRIEAALNKELLANEQPKMITAESSVPTVDIPIQTDKREEETVIK